ncbi:hypothetical protein [Martelella mediterranea]|uniref:Phage tail protein n=1 Tax=Martelella mediterranea DSM 17316 TaxID=1122214 RepID=A0A1U9YYU4_9HYPH|nr:hypothetical protein [Martelella mediterranea]AQZ50532.1 hypothetical protein Mame_01162 [Martelella mediterranea DSM 17316]
MSLFAVAGTTIHIGAARAGWMARRVSASDFSGETWLEVPDVQSIGRAGGEWALEEILLPDPAAPDAGPITGHMKTAIGPARLQLSMGASDGDEAYDRLLAAYHGEPAYGFRVVFPNGSERLFVAIAVSWNDVLDAANIALATEVGLMFQSSMVHLDPEGREFNPETGMRA